MPMGEREPPGRSSDERQGAGRHGIVVYSLMGRQPRRVDPEVSGAGIRALARRVWERWKVIAHIIGNFQARCC
jgi:hypothetical protein